MTLFSKFIFVATAATAIVIRKQSHDPFMEPPATEAPIPATGDHPPTPTGDMPPHEPASGEQSSVAMPPLMHQDDGHDDHHDDGDDHHDNHHEEHGTEEEGEFYPEGDDVAPPRYPDEADPIMNFCENHRVITATVRLIVDIAPTVDDASQTATALPASIVEFSRQTAKTSPAPTVDATALCESIKTCVTGQMTVDRIEKQTAAMIKD